MSYTDYTEAGLLNSLFGKTSVFGVLATAPVMYVFMSTADPGEDGSGIAEPVGNGYARVATVPGDWNSATGNPTTIDNANTIVFAAASGPWGTLTHFGLADAVSAGNVISSGPLINPKTVDSPDAPQFDAGDFKNTLD